MLEWNIQSRAHQCQITSKPFSQGESFHTVLLESKIGFERMDLSTAAWKEHGTDISSRPNFISHWMGTYEPPPAAPPDAIKKDDAESLLRALLDRKDEQFAPAVFILAVMLERKRVLRVKSQVREKNRRIIVYEHAKTGDILLVNDPDLQLAQLEKTQHDVSYLLEHGIPAPAVPVEPGVPGEPTEEPFNSPSEINTLAPV